MTAQMSTGPMATEPSSLQPLEPAPVTQPRPRWTKRLVAAVDERLGIDALRYPVPAHANNLAYSLGALAASSLLILVVTGIILGQYYSPEPATANASVRQIVEGVYFGRFTRAMHFWAAQAMYVLLILHLLRIYVTGSYKRPREANWLIGLAMFALTIGALFTGTVLKWDQEGFEALSHNLEVARLLGGLGFWFDTSFAPQVPLLVRLYIAHVSMIPAMIAVLLVLHALLVKRHKISPAPGNPTETGEPLTSFTTHLRRVGTLSLVLLGGIGVLAVLFPPEVGPAPIEGIEITQPPWIYWWMFTLENWLGLSGILWGTGVLFVLLAAVPFIDRRRERRWYKRPIAMILGFLVLATIVALTIMVTTTPAVEHLS